MEHMLKTKRRLTYEDYAALPDDRRYELIWGEIVVAPAPDVPHQSISGALFDQLRSLVKRGGQGRVYIAPLDVVLDRHNTVQPDLIFVSKEREEIVKDKNIQGAPDLLIEIVSPSSGDRDNLVKARLYEEHGIREYWVVDRYAEQITVHVLKSGRYEATCYGPEDRARSTALPGLEVEVAPLVRIRR
jgi:Uma2 family endonuclease